MGSFSASQILAQLDECSGTRRSQFPVLDDAYWYPVGVRLSAYSDMNRWFIVTEKFAFNPRRGGHDGVDILLTTFGNFVDAGEQIACIHPTSDGPAGPTFFVDDFGGPYVRPDAVTISVRGQLIPVATDISLYQRHNIPLEASPNIEPQDMFRMLYAKFPELFHASDEQLRDCVAPDVPLVLRLYGWRHPRIIEGERPSDSPSFVAIAEALADGSWFDFSDPGIPNTHWSNWPLGGSL